MDKQIGYKLGTKENKTEIIIPKINEKEDYFIVDNVVYFSLNGRGKDTYAMVSTDKWTSVSKYQWYLGKAGYPICYQLHKMSLHQFIYKIMGYAIPPHLFIDHADRNKLNNTDENLRLATPQENAFNKTTTNNKKGVKKISDGNYTATIVKDGIVHEIKNISTETQAAEVYNMMAEELFGQFASFNKIEEGCF